MPPPWGCSSCCSVMLSPGWDVAREFSSAVPGCFYWMSWGFDLAGPQRRQWREINLFLLHVMPPPLLIRFLWPLSFLLALFPTAPLSGRPSCGLIRCVLCSNEPFPFPILACPPNQERCLSALWKLTSTRNATVCWSDPPVWLCCVGAKVEWIWKFSQVLFHPRVLPSLLHISSHPHVGTIFPSCRWESSMLRDRVTYPWSEWEQPSEDRSCSSALSAQGALARIAVLLPN